MPLYGTTTAWLKNKTYRPPLPSAEELLELKRATNTSTTVCLPALNEEATIEGICRSIRRDLVDGVGLVDELLVVDSGSHDRTAEIASAAGAAVVDASSVLSDAPCGSGGGKGAALWKSLHVTTGDVLVWLDSDVTNFSPRFVCGLLWPLLLDPDVHMTKAFYQRPLQGQKDGPPGGGRVTEMTARPLLQLLLPDLGGIVQPLAGECAIRRSTARSLPFITGYGVDVALLIDLVQSRGLDALAQVDLGRRAHRNKTTDELGRMAFEVARAILSRAEAAGEIKLAHQLPEGLIQFDPTGANMHSLAPAELPPMEVFRPRAET
ncbi:MAG: glucosyl-3-phosphoglycerate synthase [Actinomycetota bacterium]|nr:glucosyl-3-phosphoglycerate synthase [Actinomycetota bacterium]